MAYNTIIERGGGGFGVVHEVEDNQGRRLAKKTLRVPVDVDPAQVIPRFEREVKYQSAIEHPNVVEILDHNLDENPPWFIMPLAVCSLKDRLLCDRQLGGEANKPLFDILAGLEEIHRRGFLHRDLKPANVLVFCNDDGTER
jgi:serine/threonine protein kinase